MPGTFTWRENPFEGGSDHVPFLERGLPAVLGWHFTDSAYHTTMDRLDRVSGPEMRRVGAALGALGVTMASEDPADLREILRAVDHHAWLRLRTALAAAEGGEDPALERRVVEAWVDWYDEAYASVAAWPARPPEGLEAEVAAARRRWRELASARAAEVR